MVAMLSCMTKVYFWWLRPTVQFYHTEDACLRIFLVRHRSRNFIASGFLTVPFSKTVFALWAAFVYLVKCLTVVES